VVIGVLAMGKARIKIITISVRSGTSEL